MRDDRTLVLFAFRSHGEIANAPESRHAILRRGFADAGWKCPSILAVLDAVDELHFDVVSQVRMDYWLRGRVVLMGDAAACVSLLGGEWTGLAMMEAYMMAGELHRVGGDGRVAFERL